MSGRVLKEVFSADNNIKSDRISSYDPYWIESDYNGSDNSEGADRKIEKEMVQQLKALGYVE